MIVGLLSLDLHLPGCGNLKEKRSRLKGVIEKARSRFNVSVSETGHQDLHQSAKVGIAMVNENRELILKVFNKAEEFFDIGDGITIVESVVEWF